MRVFSHITLVTLSTLASYSRGDMCQDFCVQQLGRAGCSKGSWCKNQRDCHSIFWTSADKTAICVFTGSADCKNTHPVLCSEADSGIARRPAEPVLTTPGPTLRVPSGRDDPTTTVAPRQAPVSTTSSTTTSTRPITSMRADPSPGTVAEPVELSLHYNPFEYDPRPRIKVSFLAHGEDLGFSVMFDTGSDVSHILKANGTEAERVQLADAPPSYLPQDDIDSRDEPVTRPAKWGEGYLDVGFVGQVGGERDLHYGNDDAIRAVPVSSAISEVAVLYSGASKFTHEIEIELTKRIDNRHTGIGLFGAGRTSHFARAAGVFAYVGAVQDYQGWALASAGRLFIGETDVAKLNRQCERGTVQFFPLLPMMSRIHWVVAGSMELAGADVALRSDMTFIIDTGATNFYVTSELLAAVKAQLVASGAELISAKPDEYEQYMNCWEYQTLPHINIKLGTGANAVSVIMTPDDYVGYNRVDGTCLLALKDSSASGSNRLIGIKILSKLLTVFDQRNDRIGFCNTRP
jgi:hypothetical protein